MMVMVMVMGTILMIMGTMVMMMVRMVMTKNKNVKLCYITKTNNFFYYKVISNYN